MTLVVFTRHDGGSGTINAESGVSLMEAAVAAGVDEILADCGGALSCATCHVYVDSSWYDRLSPPDEVENELLEFAIDRRPTSRLSCQIQLTPELDGISIELPERQQ